MKRFVRALNLFFIVTLPIAPLSSQVRQIDSSKLPPDSAVQNAYKDLESIDQFARTYEQAWRFPVPKSEVQSRFRINLLALEDAQRRAPSNSELQLFTGLVAHLGYNLDIEEAYEPAMKLLRPQAASDFRAAWFLGMHQCQSNDVVGGMKTLLSVEASTSSLPRAFWQDYAICATTANMPVHAVRAYDNAHNLPDRPPTDEQLEQLARNRIKPSSLTATYPAKQVWYAESTTSNVRFTSYVCGESFTTKESSPIDITDVAKGSCTVIITSDQYPNRHSSSTASLLVLTQPAKPGESLDAFAQRLLSNPRYANRAPISGVHCPVASCLSFEIVTDKLYKSEGGAHLLAVFFQSDQPAYPGLRYESPQPFPKKPSASGEPTFFRASEFVQRLPGTLYTFIALDSNQDIYSRARVDFDNLLNSFVVDSK
jgi:hypothetical protein